MELLPGKEVALRVTGMISDKYQVHGYAVAISVKNIFEVDPTGQVDFGGGEYTAAGKLPVEPLRRNREDKYTWWELDRGSYFVEFNETLELAPDELGVLEADERLIRAGATHVATYVRGRVAPLETLLRVETLRVALKQNARISRVRVFKLGGAAALPPPALPSAAEAKTARPRRKK
jgi:deoxycytidine triphosphate deaminase